ELTVRLLDEAIVDESLDVGALDDSHLLEHGRVVLEDLDPLRLDGRVEREKATAPEVEVEDLLGDGRPLLLLRRRLLGIPGDPLVGLDNRLQIGHDDLRVLLQEILADDGTMQIGDRRLAAIEDLPREALELHELAPRTEVRVRVDLL